MEERYSISIFPGLYLYSWGLDVIKLLPIAAAIYLLIPLLLFYKLVTMIQVSDKLKVILLLVLIVGFCIVTYVLFQYLEYLINASIMK